MRTAEGETMVLLNKKFMALILIFGFIFIYSAKKEANACSSVFWDTSQGKFIARTLDFNMPSDKAKIFFYPRGIKRDGQTGKNSFSWESKYATLVMACLGEIPVVGGFNEKGLSANKLHLEGSKLEARDSRPAITNNMWAQYVLDNFATVEEVLKGFKKVQITTSKFGGKQWLSHIFIQDKSGDSAIIEFIGGKAVIYRGRQYNVITNEPQLDVQLANLNKYSFSGGKLQLPGDIDSESRFVRLTFFLKCLPEPQNIHDAVSKLIGVVNTVLVPSGSHDTSGSEPGDAWPTLWYNITDLTHKVMYFHATSCPNLISVDFNNFKPDSNDILYLDPYNRNLTGEVSGLFKKYKN